MNSKRIYTRSSHERDGEKSEIIKGNEKERKHITIGKEFLT